MAEKSGKEQIGMNFNLTQNQFQAWYFIPMGNSICKEFTLLW